MIKSGVVKSSIGSVNLTGVSAAETDPTFQAASGAYNTHLQSSGAVHFTSGAIYTEIGVNTTDITALSGAHLATSGALATHLVNYQIRIGGSSF